MFSREELISISKLDGLSESVAERIKVLLKTHEASKKYRVELNDDGSFSIVGSGFPAVCIDCGLLDKHYSIGEPMMIDDAIDRMRDYEFDGPVPYAQELANIKRDLGGEHIVFFYGDDFSFDAEDFDETCESWIEVAKEAA